MANYRQGAYTVKNIAKYVGRGIPRYRSGWELTFMMFLDSNENVLQWASESISIPYRNPLTGKQSMYVPDFLVTYRGPNNTTKAELIEIKPKKQSLIESKMNANERAIVAVNYAKWDSATKWAKKNGLTFRVINEDQIYHQGNKKTGKQVMTRKLESLFDFPPTDESVQEEPALTTAETRAAIVEIDNTIDKIDAALPAIRDLDASDRELDDIAEMAKESYQNLSDLGFNVDSRYASELFAVASTMLGHALTAKTTKLNKKLKMLDLQMKKLKLDQDAAKNAPEDAMETAHGQVLNRNDLLERLMASRDQKTE